jgi:hypothetical protein
LMEPQPWQEAYPLEVAMEPPGPQSPQLASLARTATWPWMEPPFWQEVIPPFDALGKCCVLDLTIANNQRQSGSRDPSPVILPAVLVPSFSQSRLVIISKTREGVFFARRGTSELTHRKWAFDWLLACQTHFLN